MPIISDEQICREDDEENEEIYANIMQNSDSQGKISVWKMEFDSKEHAHQLYNEYAKEFGFSIRKQWKNEDRFSRIISSRRFVCYKEGYKRRRRKKKEKKKEKRKKTSEWM